jgi:hypothetical protein
MDTPTTYASRRWAELAQADEWARLEAMDRRVELMAPEAYAYPNNDGEPLGPPPPARPRTWHHFAKGTHDHAPNPTPGGTCLECGKRVGQV